MKTLLMALALIAPLAQAATPDVATMLKNADAFRGGGQQQIDTRVEVSKPDGSLDKERRYTVITGPERRSLVLMQSPAEKGQKVLMLGDDFWLVMPGSQRPMRITPTQKLLGDASTGDVATQSWSDDYEGELVGEERCEAAACWHLRLKAKRRGVSYQRIELWLGKTRHEPLTAELYVQSEKLAKTARFVLERNQVTEMVLQDSLGSRKLTRLHYLARKDRQVPEGWFNPMFLARSPVLE
ncbi:outer membrane lipoprotein-sorting protein [Pelomonas sp. V22]|uniref:outer membrane lipoprotein-sorting protein n=1 Tax=Pelomonas sp. V22 TaxID=2822139 RepID=UPI0024A91803|nr:outer membrane lipoprotein-sorting protein [Pelomonas sp. V22]MDI4632452.1 outer membrane lipoprotein-sorting protein [Pelomonas sp. V22]